MLRQQPPVSAVCYRVYLVEHVFCPPFWRLGTGRSRSEPRLLALTVENQENLIKVLEAHGASPDGRHVFN
jgi:hypothetical protein